MPCPVVRSTMCGESLLLPFLGGTGTNQAPALRAGRPWGAQLRAHVLWLLHTPITPELCETQHPLSTPCRSEKEGRAREAIDTEELSGSPLDLHPCFPYLGKALVIQATFQVEILDTSDSTNSSWSTKTNALNEVLAFPLSSITVCSRVCCFLCQT